MKNTNRVVALLIAIAVGACIPVFAGDEHGSTSDIKQAVVTDSDAKFFDKVMKIICASEPVPKDKIALVYDPATGKCVPFKESIVEW